MVSMKIIVLFFKNILFLYRAVNQHWFHCCVMTRTTLWMFSFFTLVRGFVWQRKYLSVTMVMVMTTSLNITCVLFCIDFGDVSLVHLLRCFPQIQVFAQLFLSICSTQYLLWLSEICQWTLSYDGQTNFSKCIW